MFPPSIFGPIIIMYCSGNCMLTSQGIGNHREITFAVSITTGSSFERLVLEDQ